MDPDTGEIRGMDSSDWYDLNDPRDLSSFYTREEIDAMSEEGDAGTSQRYLAELL